MANLNENLDMNNTKLSIEQCLYSIVRLNKTKF